MHLPVTDRAALEAQAMISGSTSSRKAQKMDLSGVIFDMDGVLVDTEPLHRQGWLEVFAALGAAPQVELDQWIGIPDRDLAHHLVSDLGLAATPEELLMAKRRCYQALIRRQAQPLPGMAELLRELAFRNIPCGVASSSSRQEVSLVIETAGLAERFAAIVTHEDVSQHKPDPSPYILAASRLGLDPRLCAAIEDSPAGIEAALAAGMATYALTTSFGPERLQRADHVMTSPAELAQHLLPRLGQP